MRYQDYMIDATRNAALEAFRNAKAVPEEKWSWSPMDNGRTVLDQCREMAKCPDWANAIVSGGDMPEWTEEFMTEQRKEMEQWKSPEECEKICLQKLEQLFATFRSVSDERLKETKWLPYDGGRDFTVMEMMDYPRWNFNYHNGQVSYIQTLYGDKDMH